MGLESFTTDELKRKRFMLLSMRINQQGEELKVIDKELSETEQELSRRGHKVYREPQGKADLSAIVGAEPQAIYDKPTFLKPSQIKTSKRDLSKVIKSGIALLDKRIIGFNPAELSIWSGSNGSGKSSILSQLAIEGIEQGFKVAMFSGELMADRVLNWLQLQCAGKKYTQATKYENFYTVAEQTKEKINKWLEDKLYIYNNDLGTKVENVLSAIKDCIEKNKINMVILDNMMSLDLASVNGDRYEKQTALVLALCELAKKYRIHIHFVCHPRKSIGFLRKNDISGTADITNSADNVFIIHRVNTDFKRLTKQDLGLKEDNPLYSYSNVIEICKSRDTGVCDEFIGLYFEKESKRFLNTKDEAKRYGWEAGQGGFMAIDNDKLPFDGEVTEWQK
jgi:archaellum biogenesis ATPase FlaH